MMANMLTILLQTTILTADQIKERQDSIRANVQQMLE